MRFTSAERAEIARLFRSKLASFREKPPPRTPRRPRRRTIRPPTEPPAEQPGDDALLRTSEVAALLGVSPRTVAHSDLPCLRTLGGHRRSAGATCVPEFHGTNGPDLADEIAVQIGSSGAR